MTTVTVRTRLIELNGGRVLHVCRFGDPATGRDLLALATDWNDSSPLPTSQDTVVELPGSVTGELIEALRSLEDEAG